jgi:putative FmdB family regulatory protein
MPLYDYHCTSCKHKFEQFEKVKDRNKPTKKACPSCNKKNIELSICMPAVCDPVNVGVKKHDKGWTEVLSKFNRANRTNIQSKYS